MIRASKSPAGNGIMSASMSLLGGKGKREAFSESLCIARS